jgi:hypothetical protein
MAADSVSHEPDPSSSDRNMFISCALPHSERSTFEAHDAPNGPQSDAEPLLCGKSAALLEDHVEDLAFLDSIPCPGAVSEQAASNKRTLPSVIGRARVEDRPAKARRLDQDELELLDSSTGAAAVYELIGGRFVEVHARSMLPAHGVASVPDPLLNVDLPQPRPHVELLLDKEGWLAWAESLELALFAETAP